MPEWWGVAGASCGGTVAQKVDGDVVTYVPVLCKCWSCDVCSYYRYAWLVRNIVGVIDRGDVSVMWTLTLKTGTRTPDESFEDIKAAWIRLRHRLNRERPGLEFVWVVETTKMGYAHMHVLLNRFVAHWKMSDMWKECTGDSMVVRFDKIKSGGAGRYIAKYVGKEARQRRLNGQEVRPYHLFGKSEGVVFEEFMPKGQGWTVVESSWRENAEWCRENAVVLVDEGMGTGKLVVELWNGAPKLRAWGNEERAPPLEFPGKLANRIADGGEPKPAAEYVGMAAATRAMVDAMNARPREARVAKWEPDGRWELVCYQWRFVDQSNSQNSSAGPD
jgi:hypothetical protein